MKIREIRSHWNRLSLLELSLKRASPVALTERRLALGDMTVNKKDYFFLHPEKNSRIINPENRLKILWDIIIASIIILDAFMIPVIITFPEEITNNIRVAEYYSQIFFICDIIINLNTGFYENGHLNSNKTKIFIEYLKGTLVLDFISILPLELANVTLESLDLFLFFKLYRVYKLLKCFKKIELVFANLLAITIFNYFKRCLVILVLIFWMSCVWMVVSNYDVYNIYGTWEVVKGDSGAPDIFLKCLYFSIQSTTTLGYGDFGIVGINEHIAALIILTLGVTIFSFNITAIIEKVVDNRKKKIQFSEKMITLNLYMNEKNLPGFIRFKLRRFLQYTSKSEQKSKIKENQILALLSDPLREEIFEFTAAGKIIPSCKVFLQIYEGKIIRKLSKYIYEKVYGPNDIILDENELSTDIYFLVYGDVEVMHKKTQSVFMILSPGSYFGEIGFFTKKPRTATIKCVDVVETLCLKRQDLDKILYKFPRAAAQTQGLEIDCVNGDYTLLGVSCYLCGNSGHIASKCDTFTISGGRLNVTKKWLKSKSSSKAINPKSYYHTNAYRKGRVSKPLQINKIPEEPLPPDKTGDTLAINTLVQKVSVQRLETIKEETIITSREITKDQVINRILSSEESDQDSNKNAPIKNLGYQINLPIFQAFLDENEDENI
jgi:Cyclic nucleotide-binding domain